MTQSSPRFNAITIQLVQEQGGLVMEALGWLLFVASVELVFAFSFGGDHLMYFARGAASLFLALVLLLVWSSLCAQRGQYPREVHGQ